MGHRVDQPSTRSTQELTPPGQPSETASITSLARPHLHTFDYRIPLPATVGTRIGSEAPTL
jgi:hypothetical protein